MGQQRHNLDYLYDICNMLVRVLIVQFFHNIYLYMLYLKLTEVCSQRYYWPQVSFILSNGLTSKKLKAIYQLWTIDAAVHQVSLNQIMWWFIIRNQFLD